MNTSAWQCTQNWTSGLFLWDRKTDGNVLCMPTDHHCGRPASMKANLHWHTLGKPDGLFNAGMKLIEICHSAAGTIRWKIWITVIYKPSQYFWVRTTGRCKNAPTDIWHYFGLSSWWWEVKPFRQFRGYSYTGRAKLDYLGPIFQWQPMNWIGTLVCSGDHADDLKQLIFEVEGRCDSDVIYHQWRSGSGRFSSTIIRIWEIRAIILSVKDDGTVIYTGRKGYARRWTSSNGCISLKIVGSCDPEAFTQEWSTGKR